MRRFHLGAAALGLALLGVLVTFVCARADEPSQPKAPAADPTDAKDKPAVPADAGNAAPEAGGDPAALSMKQDAVSLRYKRFEKTLRQMAEYMRKTDPDRAGLLYRAINQSSENRIAQQLDELVALLGNEHAKLGEAVERQQDVNLYLTALLKLLQSEDRKADLDKEKKRLEELVKQVNELIVKEKKVRNATDRRQGDPAKIADEQQKVADDTRQLEGTIDRQDVEKLGESRKGKKGKNPSRDGKQSDADSKDGETKDGESKDGESKDGEQKDGGAQDGKGKSGGDKSDGKGSAGKKADGKNADGKKSDSGKPDDKQPGEEKQDQDNADDKKSDENKADEKKDDEDKPGDPGAESRKSGKGKSEKGKSGKGKPSKSQPGKGKSGESEPSEGNSGEQKQDDPQEQNDSGDKQPERTPGREELEKARQEMEEAIEKLKSKKLDDASGHQDEALKQLIKAKERLEEILRQLREEERELLLAALEARFQKMLAMQILVNKSTVDLSKVAKQEWTSQQFGRTRELSGQEDEIAIEAAKALTLLKEEGSSVAFPEAVTQLHQDMLTVARRLERSDVAELTQGIEQDIVESLSEIIEALRKEMEKLKEEQQQQQKQMQQQQGDKSLVDQLAELKMLRSLQHRVNRRTKQLGSLTKGDQATDPDAVSQFQQLSQRQARIQEATYDLSKGKNR